MLSFSEAFALGLKLGRLVSKTEAIILDADTKAAAQASWEVIRAAMTPDGPKGRKVTRDERKAIQHALLDLLTSLADISSDEAHELHNEVVSLAHQLVEDVLD